METAHRRYLVDIAEESKDCHTALSANPTNSTMLCRASVRSGDDATSASANRAASGKVATERAQTGGVLADRTSGFREISIRALAVRLLQSTMVINATFLRTEYANAECSYR